MPLWLQNMGGGPDVFADMLEKEYRLNNTFGMTFGMADQEYRKQLEAQRAMAVTLLIAPAIGSLADRMVNGSAKGAYANNAYDNLERQGTTENFKGNHFPWTPPKVGMLNDAKFAQKTYSKNFSKTGQQIYSNLAGKPIKTIDDLVNAIKNSLIKPSDIPID